MSIYSVYLVFITLNVLDNWRFCCYDKGTRSVPATAKMWRNKTPQRRLRRLGFSGARGARSAAKLLSFVEFAKRVIFSTLHYFKTKYFIHCLLFLTDSLLFVSLLYIFSIFYPSIPQFFFLPLRYISQYYVPYSITSTVCLLFHCLLM